jgi:BlaI family penicillinase repressor
MDKELPPALSAAQLEVMDVVWRRGETTISEVWQELAGRRKIARATVQTVMARLEEKGWLKHRDVGQAFLYSAAHQRDASQGQMVKELVDSAFAGAADGLVWALVHGRGLSSEEAQRIRQMIEEAESKKRKGGKKR